MVIRWMRTAMIATLAYCCTACADFDSFTDGAIGCETAARTGEAELWIVADDRRRTYSLVVPDGYEAGTPMPVVFAWHGLGGGSDGARLDFGVELEAEADGAAIIVYPQGLRVPLGGGTTGWELDPAGRDVAFFDAMLQQLDDQSCVDRTRVFSAGHSYGAYMTLALGCHRAHDLRAIGAVAGGPPMDACEPDGIAALLVHGIADEIVAVDESRRARDQLLERNGCDETTTPVDPAPCVAYDGCDPSRDLRWCEHTESAMNGHAWPSFATVAIWDFFERLGSIPG
jgi:polyhydroxybutyrate depolymerase